MYAGLLALVHKSDDLCFNSSTAVTRGREGFDTPRLDKKGKETMWQVGCKTIQSFLGHEDGAAWRGTLDDYLVHLGTCFAFEALIF